MDAEVDARLDAIDEQIARAGDKTRARFEKRKAEIQANHQARKKRLQDAISVADAVTT